MNSPVKVRALSSDLRSTIQYYIQQELGLLNQINGIRQQKSNPGVEIGKNLVGELGAALAADIFGDGRAGKYGRRITRGYLDHQHKAATESQMSGIASQHDFIVNNARDILSNVSELKPNLMKPNSDSLINKLNRAQEYSTIDTRIRRTISVLQVIGNKRLIHNSEIPKLVETKPPERGDSDPHIILRNLELKLRIYIQTRLQSISPNWWREKIPVDVRQSAEDRKKRNEKTWPWLEQRDLHPIHYVDFTDYVKIIRRKDNWEQVFKSEFKDEEIVSVKLRELEPIRNAIAHNRELSMIEKERLRLLSNDMLSCLH